MRSMCAGVTEVRQGQQIEVENMSTEPWMWSLEDNDTVLLRVK